MEEPLKSVPNPCKGYCPDRNEECHGKCEKYAAYRKYRDECVVRKVKANERFSMTPQLKKHIRDKERRKTR